MHGLSVRVRCMQKIHIHHKLHGRTLCGKFVKIRDSIDTWKMFNTNKLQCKICKKILLTLPPKFINLIS